MKRKMKRLLFSFALMGMLVFQCITPVYAYDWATDEYTDDGYFLVDNWKDRGTHVTLYLYTEIADRNIAYNMNYYTMKCVEGNVPPHEIPEIKPYANIMFQFRPENKTIVQDIGDGQIWSYEFSIENGTYEWSQYEGNGGTNIHTYDSNFNLTFLDENIDPRYGCETEKIKVNGESVRIYAVYGHKEFAQNANEYREWAIANEEKEREETVNTEILPEPTEEPEENIEATEIPATPEPTEEPQAEASKESIAEPTKEPEGDTVYVEEEKGNIIIPVVIIVLVLALAGGVVFKIKKSKK